MGLNAGDTFGPYQVIEPLGRGGMATVYKCYEAPLDRFVALKVLPGEFLHDESFSERFRREAKVIARLEHPNIVPIHAFGIEGNTPWMAMRLIAGGSVSGFEKSGEGRPASALVILRGVAEALDYAHSKGVVHRDVKPQNILLDDAGRVYLADFGIAKMVEGTGALTQTGMISGTPHYMAPEQARGTGIDHRADIYALGIVAYQLLTGRVPFAADTPVAILMKHISEPVPLPSPVDVPPAAGQVLLKALAKEPGDRWPTSRAFVDALEQALGAAPTLPNDHPAAWVAPAPQGTAPTLPTPLTAATRVQTQQSRQPATTLHQDGVVAPQRSGSGLLVGLALSIAFAALLLAGGIAYYVFMRPPVPDPSADALVADQNSGLSQGNPVVPTPGGVLASESSPLPSSPASTPTPTPMPVASTTTNTSGQPSPRGPASPAVAYGGTPTPLPPTTPPKAAVAQPTPQLGTPTPAPSLRAGEAIVAYSTGMSIPLSSEVGAIRLASVRIQQREGRGGKFKRMVKKDAEPWVTIKTQFEVLRTKGAGDWNVTLKVDLLDAAFGVVEGARAASGVEDDRSTQTVEIELPQRQLEAVKSLRVALEAVKD